MSATTTDKRFASAISDAPDTKDALGQVLADLAGKITTPVDLLLVFVTAHHRDHFETIHRRFDDALSPRVSIAVTAAGVIGVGRELEDSPGLSVFAANLPGVTAHPFSYEQIDWPAIIDHPEAMRESLTPDQPDDLDLKAILLFADPFSTPMVSLLPAIGECWPDLPVVGGMASAANKPEGNRLMINGQVMREGAVGVALAGDVEVHTTLSQGCRPIGKPYVITGAKRHLVYQLGGKGALDEIQELIHDIDDDDRELIQSRGLMIGRVINEYKDHFGRGDFLIRHLVGVDQEAGYVAVNDPQVRVGQTVQFHVHDHQTAQEDFKLLLDAQKLHGPAGAALLFSCNGRGTQLFNAPDTDAGLVHDALGNIPLAGFFAAGEIGPVGHQNFVHGHTASLLVFRNGQADSGSDDTP